MNYYDEEITIGREPDAQHQLGNIKVDRLPSGGVLRGIGSGRVDNNNPNVASGSRTHRATRQRNILQGTSTSNDDDGLLQDIIDHDDENDDEDDDDDSDVPKPLASQASQQALRSANRRPQTRPAKTLDHDTDEMSETESDEGAVMPLGASGGVGGIKSSGGPALTTDVQLDITPEKWENLPLNQEVKDLFPYILKYTPQTIATPYHLQPFIPEFVPAVGDVDAFLKVTIPSLLQTQRQLEINEHLRKMGVYFLDEPSGEQSEPSLLNMKLRSVLTGSGANARSASAALIPTAKSPKDIDKWIAEVEQVHMAQSVYDAQPRKDVGALILDWPQSYADAAAAIQDAYQRCVREEISLADYIGVLCQCFEVDGGPLDTQTDYILNVQTLFALYLAANQAWE